MCRTLAHRASSHWDDIRIPHTLPTWGTRGDAARPALALLELTHRPAFVSTQLLPLTTDCSAVAARSVDTTRSPRIARAHSAARQRTSPRPPRILPDRAQTASRTAVPTHGRTDTDAAGSAAPAHIPPSLSRTRRRACIRPDRARTAARTPPPPRTPPPRTPPDAARGAVVGIPAHTHAPVLPRPQRRTVPAPSPRLAPPRPPSTADSPRSCMGPRHQRAAGVNPGGGRETKRTRGNKGGGTRGMRGMGKTREEGREGRGEGGRGKGRETRMKGMCKTGRKDGGGRRWRDEGAQGGKGGTRRDRDEREEGGRGHEGRGGGWTGRGDRGAGDRGGEGGQSKSKGRRASFFQCYNMKRVEEEENAREGLERYPHKARARRRPSWRFQATARSRYCPDRRMRKGPSGNTSCVWVSRGVVDVVQRSAPNFAPGVGVIDRRTKAFGRRQVGKMKSVEGK
ncbi:hypothetical protein DFH06DRAFT_1148809 [Mycena polygramma]|nr:hypothetical protein DFH06DRAFT_1148809 [Mycena polygramma]